MDCEEVFLCLDGRAIVATSTEERPLQAGDCLVLPPETDFSFRVVGNEPFRALACIRAGGKATMAVSGDTFVPPWAA